MAKDAIPVTAYLGGFPVSPETAREAWLLFQNEPTPEAVERMQYLYKCAAEGVEPESPPTQERSE